jgi:hypothetical protein
MIRLLVTANVPGSPILVTLMMEAICSSETLVLTRAIWCSIPKDGILHGHCRENLKFSILSICQNQMQSIVFPESAIIWEDLFI